MIKYVVDIGLDIENFEGTTATLLDTIELAKKELDRCKLQDDKWEWKIYKVTIEEASE